MTIPTPAKTLKYVVAVLTNAASQLWLLLPTIVAAVINFMQSHLLPAISAVVIHFISCTKLVFFADYILQIVRKAHRKFPGTSKKCSNDQVY